MLRDNPFEATVAARFLDFFNWPMSWRRSLWGSGIILTLKEVLEASEAVRAHVLTEESLRFLCQSAIALSGRDVGIGTEMHKKVLQDSLRQDVQPGGIAYLAIKRIVEELERSYLPSWIDSLGAASCPKPERTARAIASHLLDMGVSQELSYRWWRHKLWRESGTKTLAELVAEAHALAQRPVREYRILVAFTEAPASKAGLPSHWLSATAVSEWLRANNFEVESIRQIGGFWVPVSAKDPWAAIDAVAEIIARLSSRVSLGTQKRLRPVPRAWVEGEQRSFRLRPRRRLVEVRALHRENKLYAIDETTPVDAALELLEPLDSGSPSSAVAGGWAAIEALLSGPGDRDRVSAGDRMASLVACSYARAELTALSYQIERKGEEFAREFTGSQSNRDREQLLARKILTGDQITFDEPSDSAALKRISRLLSNPYQVLHDIESQIAATFRRLYRQRNLVLHWGKTEAVGLRACLRTAAPLVGAGVDRIAHAAFVEGTSPLELAAKARIALETVGSSGGPVVVDLLA